MSVPSRRPPRAWLALVAWLLCASVSAQQTVQMRPTDKTPLPISLPLLGADPAKPLQLLGDQTIFGDALVIKPNGYHKADVAGFTYDASKGQVTLVVDYVATRPFEQDGKATLEIGIECDPQCPIPLLQSVMGFDTAHMGQTSVDASGTPTPVWVGRESHTYTFEHGAEVGTWLSLDPATNLEPRLIRARWFYGDYDRSPLHGAKVRGGKLWLFAGVLAVLFVGVLLWLRR